MTMTLGRFTTTEEIDAGSFRQSGDNIEFESMIVGTSLVDMQARIMQLRGLVDNPDEPVVPYTNSDDAYLDGFYTDIEVEVSDVPAMYASWNVPFSVRMRRVGGYSAPQFEWIVQQMLRTNSHAITVATTTAAFAGGLFAVPSSAVELDDGFPGGGFVTRTSADGALTTYILGAPAVGDVGLASYFIPPASRYVGGCQIEVSYGGTYYPVPGTQIPAGATWRLSNGLLRASLSSALLAISPYDGTQWETAGTFQLGGLTAGAVTALTTPRIIRNSPELVVIRLSVAVATGLTWGTNTLDLSLSSGSRHLEGAWYSTGSNEWYIEPSASTASTALTGGLRSTAIDANGNRFVLAGAAAQTNTLASGRLKITTAANAFDFMVGYEIASAAPATYDAAQEVLYKYFKPVGSRQTIVVR